MRYRDFARPSLPSDLERILGPSVPDDLRAELLAVFEREPLPEMSPEDRLRMYCPDHEEEKLKLRKLRAEAEKLEAEADRARRSRE